MSTFRFFLWLGCLTCYEIEKVKEHKNLMLSNSCNPNFIHQRLLCVCVYNEKGPLASSSSTEIR
uniref:Uncharacterized protein n=1 Tax=Setaria viridis TaxID=4556 RepID=A0A4U6WFJ8_SETVI|nr:hypothetical protein SEVIR_1G168301v2 [Setaria viridis]